MNPSFPMSTIEREIKKGLNVNAVDENTDETLLMYAAHHGILSLAKVMHKNLANLEAVNTKGENAFLIACKHQKYELVDYLHLLGSKLESQDTNGKNWLHHACEA